MMIAPPLPGLPDLSSPKPDAGGVGGGAGFGPLMAGLLAPAVATPDGTPLPPGGEIVPGLLPVSPAIAFAAGEPAVAGAIVAAPVPADADRAVVALPVPTPPRFTTAAGKEGPTIADPRAVVGIEPAVPGRTPALPKLVPTTRPAPEGGSSASEGHGETDEDAASDDVLATIPEPIVATPTIMPPTTPAPVVVVATVDSAAVIRAAPKADLQATDAIGRSATNTPTPAPMPSATPTPVAVAPPVALAVADPAPRAPGTARPLRIDRLSIEPTAVGREPVPGSTAPSPAASTPVLAAAPASVILPALQAFGAAMRRAQANERKPVATKDVVLPGVATLAAPAAVATPVTPADATLDTADRRWPHAMAAQIERLRDAADAQNLDRASTRIRLLPDALGPVDVAVRRDGDQVHVHFAAADAQTRQLLADAQPRLADAAESRGLKLGRTEVSGGDQPTADRQGQQRTPAPPQQPIRPAAPRARAMTADDTDTRIA